MQTDASSESKQFAGVASGFDTKSWVDELTRIDRQSFAPTVQRAVKLVHHVDWHDRIKQDLSALRAVLQHLEGPDRVASLVASCDHPHIRASCRSAAVPGTYHLEVLAVSRGRTMHSSFWHQGEADPSPTLAPGWLQLSLSGSGRSPWRQRLDGEMSVARLAEAVTGAALGIRAEVRRRQDESTLADNARRREGERVHQCWLQLIGERPGLAHDFAVVEEYDSDGGEGLRLGLKTDPKLAACNTRVRVDHHDSEAASDNQLITEVFPGVDLRLTSPRCVGFSGVVHVDVDIEGMRARLDEFVVAYNQAMETLTAATRRPVAGSAMMQGHGQRAIVEAQAEHERKLGIKPAANSDDQRDTLHADPAIRMLRDGLRDVVGQEVVGVQPFASPLDVGLQPKLEAAVADASGRALAKPKGAGEVEIEARAFEQAATLSPLKLARLFAGDPAFGVRGIFGAISQLVEPMLRADGLALQKDAVLRQLDHHRAHIDRHEERVQRNRRTNQTKFRVLEKQMGRSQVQDQFLGASQAGSGR